MRVASDNKSQLYKLVFGEDAGKSVYDELRSRFYDVSSYTRNDPYHTAFLEGQREVIRFITSRINQKIEDE